MPASAGSLNVGVTQQSRSGLPSSVIRYDRSASPMGQSVPTCRARRVMWSMTIASRPSTTPMAWKRIAPQVPGWTVPNAVSIGCVGRPTVVGLADLVDVDAEAVGDVTDLSLELAGDGTGQHDPRLEVERLTEADRVDHDLLDAVVVVERDLVAMDLADRAGGGREDDRQLVAEEAGFDARGVDRGATGVGRPPPAAHGARGRTRTG